MNKDINKIKFPWGGKYIDLRGHCAANLKYCLGQVGIIEGRIKEHENSICQIKHRLREQLALREGQISVYKHLIYLIDHNATINEVNSD